MAMRLDVGCLSVARLRRLFLVEGQRVTPYRLRQLSRDRRRGVRELAALLRRRHRAEGKRRRRELTLRRLERRWWDAGVRRLAGVDEVGMGPLAGPVVAAAVVLRPDCGLAGVDDSKKLDSGVRLELEAAIRRRALAIGIGSADVGEIDRLNIYHAGLLAMRRAVAALDPAPERILVDARVIPDLDIPQEAVAGGDGCSLSIAAASIIAKTCRDRLMEALDRTYPAYGFAAHKGYCTPRHQAALRSHGLCPEHRRSFKFLREVTGQYSPVFYRLEEMLRSVASLQTLEEIGTQLDGQALALSDDERSKLRLLVWRRRKRFERVAR